MYMEEIKEFMIQYEQGENYFRLFKLQTGQD